jgi:hypothetical protein
MLIRIVYLARYLVLGSVRLVAISLYKRDLKKKSAAYSRARRRRRVFAFVRSLSQSLLAS